MSKDGAFDISGDYAPVDTGGLKVKWTPQDYVEAVRHWLQVRKSETGKAVERAFRGKSVDIRPRTASGSRTPTSLPATVA